MSEERDDRFWSEVGDAVIPRRSPAEWAAQRARILARLDEASRPRLRTWVAVPALAALAGGLFFLNSPILEKFLPPEAVVRNATWNARLTKVEGLVTVIPKGGTDVVAAAAGMPIDAGDCILTGVEGRAELALSAGSLIELGPLARLTVANLEEKHTFIDLDLGALVAKMHWEKSLGRRLEVRTPTAVAAVRGTEFGVEVAEDGRTSVGVFDEGRVAVRAKDAPSVQETMLEPRQEVQVSRGAAPQTDVRQGRSYLRVTELSRLQPLHERVERLRGREPELRRTWEDRPRAQRERERAPARRETARERADPPERRAPSPQPAERPQVRGMRDLRRPGASAQQHEGVRGRRESGRRRREDGPRQREGKPDRRGEGGRR